MTNFRTVDSPVGELLLTASELGLTGVFLPPTDPPPGAVRREGGVLSEAADQLAAYFTGRLIAFDLPLDLSRGTVFQQAVWGLLQTVPYGETTSYGALATRLGSPGASRAVGAANGRNPISLVVPCHRVVGSTGAITGYAGGLDRKRWLLAHERAHCGAALF